MVVCMATSRDAVDDLLDPAPQLLEPLDRRKALLGGFDRHGDPPHQALDLGAALRQEGTHGGGALVCRARVSLGHACAGLDLGQRCRGLLCRGGLLLGP
jgi:hypothetical protein